MDVNAQKKRATTRGISVSLFNRKVNERYENDLELKESLLIEEFDTIHEILHKKLLFYFDLDNFTPTVEERINYARQPKQIKKISTGDMITDSLEDLNIWAFAHFKFKEKYIKDKITGRQKALGHRRIRIPHVSQELIEKHLKEFTGLSMTYGSEHVNYECSDKLSIKLSSASTRENALNIIEKFALIIDPKYKESDNTKDNIFYVTPRANARKVDVHGMTAYLFKITLHTVQGRKGQKFKTIGIPSKELTKNK